MIVYGRNVAQELLLKNNKIRKIILQEGFNDKNLISTIESLKISYTYEPKFKLDRLASGNHQGIILDIEDFKYASLEELISEDEEQVIVILDHLEDPHNLGAIIRTCEAAGVTSIIIPKDRSVSVNPTVMKTSTGALENVKVAQVTNLVVAIKELKKHNFWIVGTDMTDSIDYREINYQGRIGLIIGNEGNGMGRLVQKECDFVAQIPMYGTVNSLNASVAAGIMIYEVIRHRK